MPKLFWADSITLEENVTKKSNDRKASGSLEVVVPSMMRVVVCHAALSHSKISPLPDGRIALYVAGYAIGHLIPSRALHTDLSLSIGPSEQLTLTAKTHGGLSPTNFRTIDLIGYMITVRSSIPRVRSLHMRKTRKGTLSENTADSHTLEENSDDLDTISVDSVSIHGVQYYQERCTNRLFSHSKTSADYVGEYNARHHAILYTNASEPHQNIQRAEKRRRETSEEDDDTVI